MGKITDLLALNFLFSAAVSASVLGDWQQRVFEGETQYSVHQIKGSEVIHGEAIGTASMLYKEQRVDLVKQPFVSWRWKIASTYGKFNERSKQGDDYPARFYVVLRTGLLPWQTLAVNYVWSSNERVGEVWPNAYTDNAMMVVLRAGDEDVGRWQMEKRNVVEDFKRLFNVDASRLEGYAIMVDGDNTGSKGVAWFSDISFSAD